MKKKFIIQFRLLATIASLFLATFGLYAQNAGSLDLSFDVGDGIINNSANTHCLGLQTDGKILVGGKFTSYDGHNRENIVRLNADGTIDTSFTTGPGFNSNASVRAIVQQPDGKILVGGWFTTYRGQTRNCIVRLNANGEIDTSFDMGTGFDNPSPYTTVFSIFLQSDGKILVGGGFTSYQGHSANSIIRLNSDGTVDTTFDSGTGFSQVTSVVQMGEVSDIDVQPDGKILVGGRFNMYNGQDTGKGIVRLHSNGSLDTSFNVDEIGQYAQVSAVGVQPDGKIIVAGNQFSISEEYNKEIIRLNADGSLDTGFDIGAGLEGLNTPLYIEDFSLQPDGKIIVGGNFTSLDGEIVRSIARLNANGTIDSTFDVGEGVDRPISAIILQNDGKIWIGGNFGLYNGQEKGQVARLNSDGSIDNSFNSDTGIRSESVSAQSVALQSSGKIIVAGDFSDYDKRISRKLVRINTDGSFDDSFQTGLGFYQTSGFFGNVYEVGVESDDKIVVSGRYTMYDEQEVNSLVRLNADGTLHTVFEPHPDILVGYGIRCFGIQPDGKIIVGIDHSPYNYVFRYNTDGTIDDTFEEGTLDFFASDIVIQPDGKILVGGNFTMFNGQPQNRIMRLNPDGSLDTTFDVGTGIENYMGELTIALQPDGKILVGGHTIITYDGQTLNKRIIRLNSDGSLDTSFEQEACGSSGGSVSTIAICPDGKIIAGGFFGCPLRNLGRFNSDGSVDETFLDDVGFDTQGVVYGAVIQPDEKIILVGEFTKYNSYFRNGILRLHGDETADVEDFENPSSSIQVYPNPTKDYINITSEEIIQSIEIYDITGRLVKAELINRFEVQQNIDNLANGTYVLKIKTDKTEVTKKIVKE